MTDAAKTIARAFAAIGEEKYRVDMKVGAHKVTADEPEALGGRNAGPSPFGLYLASLGACTAMTLKMYAERKEWPLEGLDVSLRIARVGDALAIERTVLLKGALDAVQRAKLADIVERTPVTLAVKQGVPVSTTFQD